MGRYITLVVIVAGCSGPSADPIRFSDRSDAEIVRLIEAATGSDVARAPSWIDWATREMPGCPVVQIDGNVVELGGNCEGVDYRFNGSAAVTNSEWVDSYDPTLPTDYVFDYMVVTDVGAESFDGVWTGASSGVGGTGDVVADRDGIAIRSMLDLACTIAPTDAVTCEIDGRVRLPGVGDADVSGTQSSTQNHYVLTGADTVVVDIVPNCIQWQIQETGRGHDCIQGP